MGSNYDNNTLIVVFAIGAVAIAGVVLMVGFYADDASGDPEVEDISYNQSDSKQTDEVTVEFNERGNAILTGEVVGDTQGTVVVDELTRDGNEVEATISVRSDDISDTFVGYNYEVEVSGVEEGDEVTVNHENRESKETVYQRSLDSDVTTQIELVSSSPQDTENRHKTNITSDGVVVTGNIVGSTSGQTPVIEGYQIEGDVLKLNIGLESSSQFGATVVTGYQYTAEIQGVSVDRVEVNHEGIDDVGSTEPVSKVELENTGSSGQTNDLARVKWSEDEATVTGSIVGNTGGQEVVVVDSYEQGDSYVVVLDTEVASEGDNVVVPQVITSYGYELDITGEDKLTIEHKGGEKYEFTRDEQGEREEFQYEFSNEGSADEVAELVDSTESSFVVEGSFTTGSSTCSEASLDSIERSGDTLNVELSPVSNVPIFGSCTEDLAPSPYTLRVDYEGSLDKVNFDVTQKGVEDVRESIEL